MIRVHPIGCLGAIRPQWDRGQCQVKLESVMLAEGLGDARRRQLSAGVLAAGYRDAVVVKDCAQGAENIDVLIKEGT